LNHPRYLQQLRRPPNPVHQLTFDKINYNKIYYPAGLAVERESQNCASSDNTYKEVFRGGSAKRQRAWLKEVSCAEVSAVLERCQSCVLCPYSLSPCDNLQVLLDTCHAIL